MTMDRENGYTGTIGVLKRFSDCVWPENGSGGPILLIVIIVDGMERLPYK
jgi:hypothetical protein